MPADTTELKLPGTPKPWMNAIVMRGLRTPVVRSLMGSTLLILTVTGATTGKRYTTPVQYVRDGDRLIVLSQRHRRWWRNLRSRPGVEIELAGTTQQATARLAAGEEEREAMATTLRRNPRIAKFYGIEVGPDGEPDPVGLDRLQHAMVAIVIDF